MNITRKRVLVVLSLLLLASLSGYGQTTTVYDSLNTAVTGGYGEASGNNIILGDSLTLTSGGTLANFGASLYNLSGGDIITGTTTVNFYDNTIPYTSGPINNPLLGTITMNWDYTGAPLPPGVYDTQVVNNLAGLNIVLPQKVLVTQQFSQTSGSSSGWGAALGSNP